MNRVSVSVSAAVALLGILLVGCNKDGADSAKNEPKLRTGDPNQPSPAAGPASDGTLTAVTFDGVEAAIAANKGKVVLIDCWATWCGPCVASFPKLVEKHKKYADKGLAVISLSMDDINSSEKVKSFLNKQGATFTNLHLKKDASSKRGMDEKLAYEGGIPHAVLFDREGKRVWTGHPMDPTLQRELLVALGN